MDGSLKNRRAVERRPGHTIGALILQSGVGEPPFAARARDISIAGIGLLTRRRIEPGTTLLVRRSEPEHEARAMPVQVRYAQELLADEWLLGCRFVRHLTTEDLLALG